jgi:hypothetical protein
MRRNLLRCKSVKQMCAFLVMSVDDDDHSHASNACQSGPAGQHCLLASRRASCEVVWCWVSASDPVNDFLVFVCMADMIAQQVSCFQARECCPAAKHKCRAQPGVASRRQAAVEARITAC